MYPHSRGTSRQPERKSGQLREQTDSRAKKTTPVREKKDLLSTRVAACGCATKKKTPAYTGRVLQFIGLFLVVSGIRARKRSVCWRVASFARVCCVFSASDSAHRKVTRTARTRTENEILNGEGRLWTSGSKGRCSMVCWRKRKKKKTSYSVNCVILWQIGDLDLCSSIWKKDCQEMCHERK